jgi:hypothetical protein
LGGPQSWPERYGEIKILDPRDLNFDPSVVQYEITNINLVPGRIITQTHTFWKYLTDV